MTEAMQELRRRLFFAEVSRVMPGLYGWLATVFTPVLQRGVAWPARAFALLSLLSLLGSFVLSTSRPRWARKLGVYAFIACCFGAWASLGPLLRSDQLDAVRGALGAVGFLLHALAWGAAPKAPEADALDNLVPGAKLEPRHRPPRAGAWVLGLGITLALVPMALAFGVERPSASLLAHAVALGCGVLLVGASTDVALRVGKARPLPTWRARAGRAVWSLGGLIVAAVIGLIWLASR